MRLSALADHEYFLIAWYVSGAITVLLPLVVFGFSRCLNSDNGDGRMRLLQNYNNGGYNNGGYNNGGYNNGGYNNGGYNNGGYNNGGYNNGGYNNGGYNNGGYNNGGYNSGGYNNGGYNNGGYSNGNGYSNNAASYNNQYNQNYQYGNKCSWWQLGCTNTYQDRGGNPEESALPWWWLWAEDERRNNDEVNPTLVIIYLWSVALFAGVMFYGHKIMTTDLAKLNGLTATLVMFANFSMLAMLFLGGLEGAVQDDGRIVDESGFYGQLGVLMYMTCLCWAIFALIFAALTHFKAPRREVDPMELRKVYEAPDISATPSEEQGEVA